MSNTKNTQYIESCWADFLEFLDKKDFRNARALLESVGENGFENDALSMHKKLNSAQDGSREALVGAYGKEKVEWAEKFVEDNRDDHRDYMDAHYP